MAEKRPGAVLDAGALSFAPLHLPINSVFLAEPLLDPK
jgi:hypothetical protein